ncbi:MAG TPA: hypothetical protein V6C65_24030, partial [Allocoleopsis sp.]
LPASVRSQTSSPSPSPSIAPSVSPIETRSPCDAFSTQTEAQAVFERDPVTAANLDLDRDGQACDQLSTSIRTDGYRISSGSTSDGWRYEIWRSTIRSTYSTGNQVVYYVRAQWSEQPSTLLTTGNFSSAAAAYQYFTEHLK